MDKIMNTTKYLAMLTLVMLLCACPDPVTETETLLTVNKAELEFPFEGGEQSLTIESNSNWTIVSPETFITTNPSQGSGTQEVKVTVTKRQNVQDETFTLVVRSDDGTKTVNVKITIKGGLFTERRLTVTNLGNIMEFNGQRHAEDSIIIATTVDWEIKGPEWIEAWDGARWRPLSQTTGNISGKASEKQLWIVKLRTTSANDDEDNRTGEMTISEQLTGELPSTYRIEQAGKHAVLMRFGVALYNSICCDFVCGNDVQAFYYYVSDKMPPTSEIFDDTNVKNNWNLAYPDYFIAKWALKENTKHYLVTRAVTKSGTLSNWCFPNSFYTASSLNQPQAPIEKIYQTNGGWHVKIGMNDLAAGYSALYYEESNLLYGRPDVMIAWFLQYLIQTDVEAREALELQALVPFEGTVPINGNIHLFTWAVGKNGRFSGVTDSFCSSNDKQRKTPPHSVPLRMGSNEGFSAPVSELLNAGYKIIRK